MFIKSTTGTSVIQKPRTSASGFVLGTSSGSQASNVPPSENIRKIWANRFNSTNSESTTVADPSSSGTTTERSTATTATATTTTTKVTEASSAWEEIDDDILIHSVQNAVIEINDESSDESSASGSHDQPFEIKTEAKPLISIKKELLDDLGEDDANIMMIDDEFDDKMTESLELLTDTSVIDELFGTDTLMADFNNINDVLKNGPDNCGNPEDEIVTCPICEDRMARNELCSHLDGCNGITVKVNPRQRGQSKKPLPFYKNHAQPSTSRVRVSLQEQEMLRLAGYTQEQIEKLNTETDEAREYNDRIMNELAREETQRRTSVITQRPANDEPILLDEESNSSVPEQVPCPVCDTPVNSNQINEHLDQCLQANS